MNSNATTVASKKFSPTELPVVNQPYQIATKVLGSDETGITVVDEEGQGLFIPDTMGTQLPNYSGEAQGILISSINNVTDVSIRDLYPHWEESKTDTGVAIRLLSKATDDLQQAIESHCNSGIEILNYLVFAETQLFQALGKSGFSKPLETVVSFCAWGLRNIDLSSSAPPSLSGLTSALKEIQENPFIDMNRATRLIMDLEDQGWSDESPISHAFEAGMEAYKSQDGDVA